MIWRGAEKIADMNFFFLAEAFLGIFLGEAFWNLFFARKASWIFFSWRRAFEIFFLDFLHLPDR